MRSRRASRAIVTAVLVGVLGTLLPGAAMAAVTALPTLVPTGDGSRDAAVQVRGVTLAYDAIDEGLAAADTTSYLQNQQRTAGRSFSLVTDMPADFGSMSSLSISIRARTVGVSDDSTSLYAAVVAADETTALSNEVLVAVNPGTSGWTTVSNVAISGLIGATKSTWDGARLRLRWAYTQVGSGDSTQLRLTAVELHGTYDTGSGPPPPPPTDTTAPVLMSASVVGASLTLAYDEPLDGGSVPAAGAYTVVAAASARALSAVAIGGSTVTLTLAAAVDAGDVVTLSYAVPGTNAVQDAAGNDAAALANQAVTNTTTGGGGGGGGGGGPLPTIRPTGDGTRDAVIGVRGVSLAYDAINESLASADTSTYLRNDSQRSGRFFALLTDMPVDFTTMRTLAISVRTRTVNVSNDQVTLHAQLVAADETTPLSQELTIGTNPGSARWTTYATLPFTGLTGGSKATWDGARLRLRWAFTQVGTADSTQARITVAELHGTYSAGPPPPDLTAPTLATATGNGATITLAYDEPLDAGSLPAASAYDVVVGGAPRSVDAVAVAGSSVTLTLASPLVSGDTVSLTYTAPTSGPVQDAAGNDAAALNDQVVANVTPSPPPPGGSVIASGNEITDAVRAAGLQGDGRLADSSLGIWEAATNLDTNGGFEGGTVGWVPSGGSLAPSTEQARFGAQSGRAMTASNGDAISRSVGGLVASTNYSRSLWIHRTETSAVLTVAALDNAGTGTLTSATVPAALGWHRVVLHPRTQSGQTSLTTRIASNLGGVAYFIDGAQLERNVVATPYVETNGAAATRGPSKVSVAGTPVGPTQGWVAVRIRVGWDSARPFSPDPGIVDMSVSNNDALFCYWDVASRTFHLERHRSGSGTTAASTVQSFAAGTVKTVIFAWTATEVRISVDGGGFVGTGNTTIPGQATLYIGSDQVQGNGSNRQGNADYLWVAGGSGTLTNADALTIHGFGDVDHAQADFPGSATFAWGAN